MHEEFRKRWASVNLPEIIEAAWDDMPVWVDGRPTDGEIFFSEVTFVNCAHCHRITRLSRKKVVFTCICCPESLCHSFRCVELFSEPPFSFNRWADTRVWKKCSFKATSVAITVFKVGQRAGSALLHKQAKKVLTGVCVKLSVHLSPQPTLTSKPLLVVSVSVDTHRNPQKQTASRGFPDSLLLKPWLQ